MTFQATAQADILTDALGPVDALVDECRIHLEEDGLKIAAVDPANVGMIDMEIDAGAFAAYSADDTEIGINLETFLDVVSMADADQMVSMDLDTETRKMNIAIGGLRYTLALINPDSIRQEPDIPDLDLPSTFVMPGGEVSRAVTAADLCSDHISVSAADGDSVHFTAEGDTDDVDVTVNGDTLLSGAHAGSETVESLFSLDYLDDMARPIPSGTEVSLVFGQEMPVKLRYSLADGSVSIVNMLAPRVKSE